MRLVLRGSLYALCLALLGCGGGGGGGGNGNRGTFTVSPSTLTFTATSTGGTPIGPQQVRGTISGDVSAETLFLNIRVTGDAVASIGDIVITGPTTGTANVYPVPQHIAGAGNYSSVITVTACTTSLACTSGVIGTPQTVNVSYSVMGLKSSAAKLVYDIGDAAPSPGDLVKTFNVTGQPVQNWTASSNVPWLTVSPASSTTAATTVVSASLDAAAFEARASGSYTGTVFLTPATGAAVEVPVTVNFTPVRVNYVAPYVAAAGAPGDVILRGDSLFRFPIAAVRFGNTDAVNFTLVDHGEIRATHPALPAGNYEVSLVNGQNTRTRAALRVLDPVAYSFASLDYPEPLAATPICMVHDAERDSLLLGVLFNSNGTGSSRLIRYSLASGWDAVVDMPIPEMGACALTTDGRAVLTAQQDASSNNTLSVSERDPLTLNRQLHTLESQQLSIEPLSMAVANDGRAVIATSFNSGLSFYSQMRPELSRFTSPFNPPDGVVAASGDGSLLLIGGRSGGIFKYVSNTAEIMSVSSLINPIALTINRTGTRVILTNEGGFEFVSDGNIAPIGTLPETTLAAALAPTSMRAYTYDSSGSVRTFDVSSALPNGFFAEVLPAIPVADAPGATGPFKMLITYDGRAAFIAAENRALLVPLP